MTAPDDPPRRAPRQAHGAPRRPPAPGASRSGDGRATRGVRLAPADLLGLGLLGLRTRRLRAALSALGISIGIATMVVVTGIPASSHQALMDEMSALGSDMLRAQSVSVQNKPVLLPEESVDMVRRIGPVTRVSAVANTHAQVRRSDLIDENDFSGAGLSVLAARRDLLDVVDGSLSSGRYFSPADERFPTAVLGFQAATRLGIGTIHADEPPPADPDRQGVVHRDRRASRRPPGRRSRPGRPDRMARRPGDPAVRRQTDGDVHQGTRGVPQ